MFYYQTIAPWTWSMCQAAARAKDQAASRTFNCAPHLLPHLQSLLYCLFWYCKSYFLCSRTDVPGVTRPPITFPAAQFLYLLPIQGHTPGGGRYFVSDSPKDMIGENISPRMWHMREVTCESWHFGQLASVAAFAPIVTPNPHPNAHFPCNGRLFNHTRFGSTDLAGWLWVIRGEHMCEDEGSAE